MDPIRSEILDHYASGYDERGRITNGRGRLELLRTREVVDRHLPAGPRRILDVGGGAGAHAGWLSADNHEVHLVDPVPLHVDQARSAAAGGFTVSCADGRRLPVRSGWFDAVLLLGPLYHLTDRSERVAALADGFRVLRPGGLVFAAAISRFASLFDGLARGFLFDPEFRAIVDRDLRDGQHRNPTGREHWFTTAYFHHPDELSSEASDAGLDTREVVGIEGIAAWLRGLDERLDDPDDMEIVLRAARAVESEPSLRGLSGHLLLVAERPRQNEDSGAVQ